MKGKETVKYLQTAAAVSAAAFLVGMAIFLRMTREDRQVSWESGFPFAEEKSVSGESRDDMIPVEMDGTLRYVTLPDGKTGSETAEPIAEELLTVPYRGLDPGLQRSETDFFWLPLERGKRIFGYEPTPDGYGVSRIYVCYTEGHVCEKTGIESKGNSQGEQVILPDGGVSVDGGRIALIVHHDVPYIRTGTRWDLLVLETHELSRPPQTIDISALIDRRPETGYDSVSSVAWSPDGERLALATTNRISTVDIRSGDMKTVFEEPVPADDESGPSWDNSAIVWSPSGRYIVFGGYSSGNGNGEGDEQVPDTLRLIDLERGNEVKILIQGKNIRLITGSRNVM